ncbi:aminotransferase [Magnetococcus marinus MC-1]|uniref:Aminotransferase n=1 Tax=Magnetococcus marinus (strain ATCC BAA-1437 / JCM 17883 / MC-1) TaxID=156889 RepID=A0L3N0_MAGMM|nr:succinyldiaminopimelate transaminase [Magnetococcus marinus]ABK42573.1 aminotransferase [Magnetococcus marinus MC-1]
MNPEMARLNPYPFEKLAVLFEGITPNGALSPLNISIGEPKHPTPAFVTQRMMEALQDGDMAKYPTTRGERALRESMAAWLTRRFELQAGSVDPDRHVLSANGTREAIFSVALAVVDRAKGGVVLTPNPFYQIYEGACFMAGVEPVHIDATEETHLRPPFTQLDAELLARTQMVYLCSPSNPTGAVHPLEELQELIRLADTYDFVICADECYSEIWYDAPPPGLLQACAAMGRHDFARCLVFHSLSKRSNMPGARTGFIAGDAQLLDHYFKLRTYTGCATPPFIQKAAIAAWDDEQHVEENRRAYRAKLEESMAILSPVLPVTRPEASFYLWLKVPGGGALFARTLYEKYNVVVLPGGYLGRQGAHGNPADGYIRIALVATLEQNREAMHRIAQCAQEMIGQSQAV